MDTSIFAVDLPAWLSWGSNVLYIASVGLALLVFLLVSCLVGQVVQTGDRASRHKRGTHLAH
jgi:hypothetical protein